jgi:protein-disulfide isomerase
MIAERNAMVSRWFRAGISGAVLGVAAMLSSCAGGGLSSDELTASSTAGPRLKPTPVELAKAGPLGDRTQGQSGAPVTVIEYASLGCPICGVFHQKVFPQFKKAYIDTGKVFYIYREFPIGPSPAAAAEAARCVKDKDYFRVNDKFMANKGQWNGRTPDRDLLYKIVQDTGVKRAEFDSCMANQNIKDGIVWVKQRGREFGVQGTPTFFINGQHVRGVLSFDEMRKLIDQHLQTAAKPA